MPDRLILTVLPAVRIGKDGCDRWMNIERDSKMVGKVRYSLEGERLTIYSIMIFPEYSGYGYGARAISLLKQRFRYIVADRVRFKARGFWEAVGFTDRGDGCYECETRS